MKFLALFIVIVIIFIIVSALRRSNQGNRGTSRPSAPHRRPVAAPQRPAFDASRLPGGLGLLPDTGLEASVARMEQALPAGFEQQLLNRVMSKHLGMTRDEVECHWFELKRYFLLTLLLKQTPMFGDKVDDVWHEMLMYTREYNAFCEHFAGAPIHHAPHGEGSVSMPGERAWFDWLYAHLFTLTPFSATIWNGFFRFPLDRERIAQIAEGTESEIGSSWFRTDTAARFAEVKPAVDRLIAAAKSEVHVASHAQRYEDTPWHQRNHSMDGAMLGFAGSMLFFSMMDGNYSEHMESQLPEEYKRDDNSNAGVVCSTNDDDGNGDDNGGSGCSSDSSCSSGSSCGSSGCGSGCGGGD